MKVEKILALKSVSNSTEYKRSVLEKAGTLHWFHWFIISLSLLLTVSAWYFSQKHLREKVEIRFNREASQVKELILERMQKYEDGLWAGVGFIRTIGGDLNHQKWSYYSHTINIEKKYPGINGMGVIYFLKPKQLPQFLQKQRKSRPYFKIYPRHQENEYVPIAYIEPERGNNQAVGLDIAHETNRYTAAKKARDTGKAQITGPIILVQDSGKTPGFLFYAPYYSKGIYNSVAERRKNILGMVYAPFVVKKLMQGVLSKQNRHVSIQILDGKEVLYEERSANEYDTNPMFKDDSKISLYGRIWQFHICSNKTFRTAANSNQPLTILVGGIIIDIMLFALFVFLSKANRRALEYADSLNSELIEKQERLKKANEELTQFNYRTSHDLVAPLKTIRGYVNLAKYDIEDNDLESAVSYFERIDSQAAKLGELVNNLLVLCHADFLEQKFEEICFRDMIEDIKTNLFDLIKSHNVEVVSKVVNGKKFFSQTVRIRQILENLIANGVKYSDENKSSRFVKVYIQPTPQNKIKIQVEDNGIGISKKYQEKIFEMFFRAHSDKSYGSGLGTYLVKKHVDSLHGEILVESENNRTLFTICIPNANEALVHNGCLFD